MTEIKWIKISCDLFNDEAIKLIEQMPDGDAIIVIWLKLLIMAGKINDSGFLYFKKEIPYTDEMLSTVFNRPLNTIRLAINTFQKFGMIQITDEQGIYITNWEKYQNIEGMERARELSKLRMRKSREKKKQLLLETKKENECCATLRNSNATVTHIDIDIDKDKERELDKELDIKNNNEEKQQEEKPEEKKKNFIAKSFFQKLFTGVDTSKEYEQYLHLKGLFIEFIEYKTAIKKQYKTESGVINAFKAFVKLSKNDESYARALVDNAIARGWQSIYDLPAEEKRTFQQEMKKKEVKNDENYGGF